MVFLSLLVAGCATGRPAPFDVTMEVDFGPSGRAPIRRTVPVERGATPEAALAKVCSVETGAVCCDSRETAGIDGVLADPAANRWWTVSLNGSKKVSPFKTRLKAGDVVRWEYRQYDQ